MLRSHLLFAIGVNTLVQRRDRRSSCPIELDNDHSFSFLCPRRMILPPQRLTLTHKRHLSKAPLSGTPIDRSWRRNFLGLIILVLTVASIVYAITSQATASRENDEFLVFKVVDIVPETERFTRVKASGQLSTDQGSKRTLRALLTNGHLSVTDRHGKLSCNAVLVHWEVDRAAAIVTYLVDATSAANPVGSEVEIRCHKGFSLDHLEGIAHPASPASTPLEIYGFQPLGHAFSFLKLPKHVDRVVMISSAVDIPKLYPIFCRLTGCSSAGVVDETNFSAQSKAVLRKSVLWIIEADSPQDIPLFNELLHVSKGSHFFDFYVTAKNGWWKWPSGIGRLSENVLRHILPRELIEEEPNYVSMVPLIPTKFSTGFVITEDMATRLLDTENGELLNLLPAGFDKGRSITIVK